MKTDLNIRIISNLSATQSIMLFQKDIIINTQNYKIGAWETAHIAPGSEFSTILPEKIELFISENQSNYFEREQPLLSETNDNITIFNNGGVVEMKKEDNKNAVADKFISVYNTHNRKTFLFANKDNKPLFTCPIRPDYKLNFCVKPKIYIALLDKKFENKFLNAEDIQNCYKVDFTDKTHITFNLDENVSRGIITIAHNFDEF
jgi:hypothetical protein